MKKIFAVVVLAFIMGLAAITAILKIRELILPLKQVISMKRKWKTPN